MPSKRTRLRIRLAALAIVLGAVITAAFGGNGLVKATPEAKVVLVSTATNGSGIIGLQNNSLTQFNITQLVRDATCTSTDPSNVVAVVPPTIMLPPMGAAMATVECAGQDGTLTAMQRCMFHGLDASSTDIVDFMGVCAYADTGALTTNPMTIPFGNVPVGGSQPMMMMVVNPSATQVDALSFQVDDIDGNFVIATPCSQNNFFCDTAINPIALGSAAMITVVCTPQTTGPHSALLYVDSANLLFAGTGKMLAPVMLTCTGGPASGASLDVNPSAVTLTAAAGGGSASTTMMLTNSGTGSITIRSIMITDVDQGAGADWMATPMSPCTTLPCPVPVGVSITFTPSQIGRRNAGMTIGYDDGTSQKTTQVQLLGTGQGATLAYTGPSPIDFGVVPVGMTASLTFQLSNPMGNEDTTATMSIDQGPYAVTPNPQTVSPGPPVTITASCTPTVDGQAPTGHLSFAASPLFGSPPPPVDMICRGTTSALYAMPSTLVLGEVRTGTANMTYMFSLLSADTSGAQLTLSGPPTLDMANNDLSIGMVSGSVTPVTFGVTVMPTADSDLADHVDAADTRGDSVQIPISGHVVTASYSVQNTLDLGTFCVNQPTTASTVALMSTGTATINLQAPALGQGASSAFQLVDVAPPMYPTMLAPNASARVSVTPNRQMFAGPQNDVLHWTTDVAGMVTADTQLSASFKASGAAIAPSRVDFGTVPAHTGMATQSVTIQNCNATQVTLGTPMIMQTSSAFAVVGTLPPTLGPGESTTVAVSFEPTTVDNFSATLSIVATDATNATMTLTAMLFGASTGGGTGDGGPDVTPSPPTSFYACSCGSTGGAGGMLVALAIAVVIFRSRRAPF